MNHSFTLPLRPHASRSDSYIDNDLPPHPGDYSATFTPGSLRRGGILRAIGRHQEPRPLHVDTENTRPDSGYESGSSRGHLRFRLDDARTNTRSCVNSIACLNGLGSRRRSSSSSRSPSLSSCWTTSTTHASGDRKPPRQQPGLDVARARSRSTSSSYPSHGIKSSRVQSPVSNLRVNRISLSDLSPLGDEDGSLPRLRSSSSTSRARTVSTDTSTQQAIAEAAAVITEWQGERQPIASYNKYELSSTESSPAILSCERRSSERETNDTTQSDPPCYGDAVYTCPQTSPTKPYSVEFTEAHHLDSPSPSARPSTWPKGFKRKASEFSLASLTRSFTKRPRLGIKRLASTVYRGSTRQLSRVCDVMKRQHDEEMKQFAAWKARRRRNKPADALKGKHEKGFGAFSIDRSRHGNEEWWKEGVERYHAPGWMRFDDLKVKK
ncbi:hypothetical protein G7046_g1656 [Stylonectria norvegica]|nr:hypothetical protein G7046_g1656 [Stylonectria norvegica]